MCCAVFIDILNNNIANETKTYDITSVRFVRFNSIHTVPHTSISFIILNVCMCSFSKEIDEEKKSRL